MSTGQTLLCRVCASQAQEVACQRKRLQALRLLLTEGSVYVATSRVPVQVAGFVDSVLGRIYQMLLSEKHCYFSGAPPCPWLLRLMTRQWRPVIESSR